LINSFEMDMAFPNRKFGESRTRWYLLVPAKEVSLMANTRKSTKRAIQADRRNERNTMVRSATRSALRNALEAIKAKDLEKAREAYKAAVRALSKAASKGAFPQGRAARKISRLTLLAKKALPALIPAQKSK
jgi:small subunit ribosomal protein S20